MAGEEGFEPSTKVLETHVLPLHHSPIAHATWIIIGHLRRFVNRFFAKNGQISSGTEKVRKETVYQQKDVSTVENGCIIGEMEPCGAALSCPRFIQSLQNRRHSNGL